MTDTIKNCQSKKLSQNIWVFNLLLSVNQLVIGESWVFYECKAVKLVLAVMTSNCDEKAHLRFSVTMSEAKTNECCSPPSAGKFTFASFQVIPWSPSFFHKRLVPLPLLRNKGHARLNPTILLLTETSVLACQSLPRA